MLNRLCALRHLPLPSLCWDHIVTIPSVGLRGGMEPVLTAPHLPDREIDCEGLLCPLPVLRAAKVLRGMAEDQLLLVRSTDAMALIDLPHFCAQSGHHYLSASHFGAVTRHLIRRGPDRSATDPA